MAAMISSPAVRAVIQRVSEASVAVDGEVVGTIGRGLVVLLGVGHEDGERDAEVLAEKILHLRVFPDEVVQMNRSVLDVAGGVLVVSQFTLLGDVRRGRRPSYTEVPRRKRRTGCTSISWSASAPRGWRWRPASSRP